jgi:hypothetical protein
MTEDDGAAILIFLLGFVAGVGLCLCLLVHHIARIRRASVLPPHLKQPVAVLHPLAAVRAVGEHEWQELNPTLNSSWKN